MARPDPPCYDSPEPVTEQAAFNPKRSKALRLGFRLVSESPAGVSRPFTADYRIIRIVIGNSHHSPLFAFIAFMMSMTRA